MTSMGEWEDAVGVHHGEGVDGEEREGRIPYRREMGRFGLKAVTLDRLLGGERDVR
jgi:hypothetical protein